VTLPHSSPSKDEKPPFQADNAVHFETQKTNPTTDSDKDTQLSVDELHRAAEHAGVHLSKSEVRQLMAMISTDGNDTVSNAEFMKARFLSLHDLSCLSARNADGFCLSSVKFFGMEGEGEAGLSSQLEGKLEGAQADVDMKRYNSHFYSKQSSNFLDRWLSYSTFVYLCVSLHLQRERWTSHMITAHIAKILDRDPSRVSFLKHDPGESGFISEDGFHAVLQHWNMNLSTKQFQGLCRLMTESGRLNYRNFIARIIDSGNTSSNNRGSAAEAKNALLLRVSQHFAHITEAFRHYGDLAPILLLPKMTPPLSN
jgi:Ca2+-binding EF-hand superfamily protein